MKQALGDGVIMVIEAEIISLKTSEIVTQAYCNETSNYRNKRR